MERLQGSGYVAEDSDGQTMGNRDEFSKATKHAVALRAGYRCSMPGCRQPTAGPSEESGGSAAVIGQAAHIHAAASGQGARRYLETMTAEERADISNAIWLCANHALLVDRDDATYTPEVLRAMKRGHELLCAEELRNAPAAGLEPADLVAIGPDVVCVGDLVGGDESEWTLSLRHFVEGDIHALMSYVEGFSRGPAYDRYVLVNGVGDGRILRAAPSWTKDRGGYVVRCPVSPGFPRIPADRLPRDLALSDRHDLVLADGDIATVSGLEALPQTLMMNLSAQRGDRLSDPGAGTRLAEYHSLLRGSRWFESLVKLEVIRQAAIPFRDEVLGTAYTPLQCVDRVFGVRAVAEAGADGWLPIEVDLGVKGVGPWTRRLSVFVNHRTAGVPELSGT